MYIEQIDFKNWKVYRDALFEFPKPTARRNIVLIGARNGGGKTSFLEGIFFCLYGIDAFDLVHRRGDSNTRGKQGYQDFISRALNKVSKADGDCSLSVRISFIDGSTRRIVERTWYTDPRGNYNDEELNIFEGKSADEADVVEPIVIPYLDDNVEAKKNYIALNILMPNLAPFFIFDGEHIQQLARQEHSDQVQDGLNKLFGLDLLENLVRDLTQYASDKRGKSRGVLSPDSLVKLDSEIFELSKTFDKLKGDLDVVDKQLPEISEKVESLTVTVKRQHGDNPTELAKIQAEVTEVATKLSSIKGNLSQNILSKKLPLALAVRPRQLVMTNAVNDLQSKERTASDALVESQVTEFVSEFFVVDPQLSNNDVQLKEVLSQKIINAWNQVFRQKQLQTTHENKLNFLSSDELSYCISRLSTVVELSHDDVLSAIGEKEHADQRLIELERMRKALSDGSQFKKMLDDLLEASNLQTKLLGEQRILKEELDRLKPTLAELRSKRTELESNLVKTSRVLRYVQLAEQAAVASSEYIDCMRTSRTEQLSHLMTQLYLMLAHKGNVTQVHISEDGNVQLRDNADNNLRDTDLSAGENQVFALSLVGAASKMSMAKVPVIIDTPLARLDSEHRANIVSRYLPVASEQVIVLSTDTEVVGDYKKMISSNLLFECIVQFDAESGCSTVMPGYFE